MARYLWAIAAALHLVAVASDEKRREVAERLRQMADTHHAVEASRVTRALGLEYEVYGTVMAFNSAAVQALADLIDRPNCGAEVV